MKGTKMMPNINIEDQAYEDFIAQMIRDKGLENEEKLREELSAQVNERVQDAILEALSLEQAQELEKLLDAEASDEELDGFFAGTGIDFGKVAAEAMKTFREEYLGEGNSTDMTSYNNNNNAQGQPMQGAVSETPGESDVEGRNTEEEK